MPQIKPLASPHSGTDTGRYLRDQPWACTGQWGDWTKLNLMFRYDFSWHYDVSKAKHDCCLLPDGAEGKLKTKVVPNTAKGHQLLLKWLERRGFSDMTFMPLLKPLEYIMNSLPLALADAGVTVSIVNPAQVKNFGRGLAVRTKNDRMDSTVLARYGALVQPRQGGSLPLQRYVL